MPLAALSNTGGERPGVRPGQAGGGDCCSPWVGGWSRQGAGGCGGGGRGLGREGAMKMSPGGVGGAPGEEKRKPA